MTDVITVTIPAGFDHRAVLYDPKPPYAPGSVHPGPAAPNMTPLYSIILPHTDELARYRGPEGRRITARTAEPPLIMIGDDTFRETSGWQNLCDRAHRWRVPLDKLLIGRPMKVAVQPWQQPGSPFLGPDTRLALFGVQILGDFTKSTILDEQIADAKAWFNEGDE